MKNIMDYGKAQGMLLVGEYLPKLNPFQSIDIIRTLEEWESVKSKYGQAMIHRIDYPIGRSKAKRNAVEGTNGFAESIPELISSVQKQGDNGVVLLAQTTIPSPPRYLCLGGFNILFRLGEEIIIELVGRAFDGHELTQGIACHERYCLGWNDAPFIMSRSGMARRGALQYLVSPAEYQSQREARIKFLTQSCHYAPDEVERHVPELLVWLDDATIKVLIEDIVLCLRGQQLALRSKNLTVFGVQGNIVEINGRVQLQPWEIFRPERWT